MSVSLVAQLGAVQIEVARMTKNAPKVGMMGQGEHGYQLECLREATLTLKTLIKDEVSKF